MSLLEAPCAKTSWRALLFRTILGITGALIVCFDNWWFKQANNSETCFGGHHCYFEQHVPCLAVHVCMNSEWSSYLRRPALLFCVGATIPWQCALIWGALLLGRALLIGTLRYVLFDLLISLAGKEVCSAWFWNHSFCPVKIGLRAD